MAKESVTCLTYLDNILHNRTRENRVVYSDKSGQKYIREMGRRRNLAPDNTYQVHIATIKTDGGRAALGFDQ